MAHHCHKESYALLFADVHGGYRRVGDFEIERRRESQLENGNATERHGTSTAVMGVRLDKIRCHDKGSTPHAEAWLESLRYKIMINVLLLPVQESDPTSPNLRQETLVPSRDHTHWNHTLRREGSAAPRHEA